MLTHITIRNFKRFGSVEIELGSPVVLIGPNNSGKTSAMQALALWETGLRRWNEKRAGQGKPGKRPGVAINRRDLVATDTAGETGSQIIAASHSEVLLNEAAGRHLVVAFVGDPHRLDNRGSQVLKALREFGFEHCYQAEQTGWVLYLEGSTDLAILRAFAARLDHAAALRALDRPFVHYVGNQPAAAANHFHSLREALPALRAAALFDNLGKALPKIAPIRCHMWKRREIENYVATPRTLDRYVAASARETTPGPLFAESAQSTRVDAMRRSIESVEAAMRKLGRGSPWDPTVKVTDDFLDPLFADYFEQLGLPNVMPKKSYHVLARHVPRDEIDPEVEGVLDMIGRVADSARGRG